MSVIYFDRNVFDHICTLNCGVTESDVAKIQRAVDSGVITIPASYTVIEETVPLVRVSEEAYEQHIQTVLRLIDKNIIITQENKDKYGKLPFILNQLPIPRFSVMSLSEFLESLS
jgi:hypothetical protein